MRSYIRYKYVTDPENTHVYEFLDDEAILAEMVCDLAVEMLCAPHHILLVRSTHVPSLDDRLVSFQDVVLYLVDLTVPLPMDRGGHMDVVTFDLGEGGKVAEGRSHELERECHAQTDYIPYDT